MVAFGCFQEGHLREARSILSRVDQLPLPYVVRRFEEEAIPFMGTTLSFGLFNKLKGEVRKQVGERKMRDLNWLSASGTGELPEGLLDMDLNELAKHGIPTKILNSTK